MLPEKDGKELIKEAYDVWGIKYNYYTGNNTFYGTPVPEGYDAVYIDDGLCPPSLGLRKKEELWEELYKQKK